MRDTYPSFDFGEECKGRTPTDCVIRHDEVDDSLRRNIVDQLVLPYVCGNGLQKA